LPDDLKSYAREMRKGQTDAEQLIWHLLRGRQIAGAKFRRQHPIGRYILDFYCDERKLVVELDGGQHTEQASYDEARTAFLNTQGIRVLRFWNNQVLQETEAVMEAIWQALQPSPQPSPASGRGSKIKAAFVSTNSITQGEQAGVLWGWLLAQGIRIHFAHRTFQWSNEAKGMAAVHCVIIGFGAFDVEKKTIYEYEDIRGEAHAVEPGQPPCRPHPEIAVPGLKQGLNGIQRQSLLGLPAIDLELGERLFRIAWPYAQRPGEVCREGQGHREGTSKGRQPPPSRHGIIDAASFREVNISAETNASSPNSDWP